MRPALPPINTKIEREVMKRDAAAKWLAKHDPQHKAEHKRRFKRKAGARR